MGLRDKAKGGVDKTLGGLSKVKDATTDAVKKATGVEALVKLEEYCRKYTQILVGMHEDLQTELARSEEARQDLLQRIESLNEEIHHLIKQIEVISEDNSYISEIRMKVAEIETAIKTATADFQKLRNETAVKSDLKVVARRLSVCMIAVSISVVLSLAALIVAAAK